MVSVRVEDLREIWETQLHYLDSVRVIDVLVVRLENNWHPIILNFMHVYFLPICHLEGNEAHRLTGANL